MSSSEQELVVASKVNELLLSSPTANQSVVNAKKLKRLSDKVGANWVISFLGGISFATSGFAAVTIAMSSPEAIPVAGIVGSSSLLIGVVSAIAYMKTNRLGVIEAAATNREFERIKALLYQNFGRDGGVTPGVVTACRLSKHSWVHNGETFRVTYDEDTNTYEFDRQNYFEGIKENQQEASFETELKPLFLKLKAADAGAEAKTLVKSLLSSVSQLVRTPLSLESKHEVTRLLVDANELVNISDNLAVFDESAAEARLLAGLQPLIVEAEALVANERKAVEQRFDSYAGYVENRSKELSSS